MPHETILQVEDVQKSFGGLQALSNVHLEARSGEITGLIGPNGSGKTTLFNIISGFLDPDSGRVLFSGRPIQDLRPHEVARLGLYRTFQASLNPKAMTVMENMLLTPQGQTGEKLLRAAFRRGEVKREERRSLDRAWEMLELVDLAEKADTLVGNLSGGQKKLLSLAQALMADPRLILLDEPVAGVNPKLIQKIVSVIRELQNRGNSFLLVEHNMEVIRRVCNTVYVLDAGIVLASGEPEETLQREEVLQAYLAAPRAAEQEPEGEEDGAGS
jgi:ABC-type branched-subunit amino acid transport system ATPase component